MSIRYILLVFVFLSALIVLLVLAITHRPSMPYVITGKTETLELKIDAPEILSDRGIEPGYVDLNLLLDHKVSYATKLEFETRSKIHRVVEPESPIHLFYLFFSKPTPITLRLDHNAKLQISGGGQYKLPNAEKIKYNIEFVFSTAPLQPLWILSPKDPIEVGKGQIIGFGVKDAVDVKGSIYGYFFAKKDWKVPTLNYPLFNGYEAKVSVPATEAFLDVTPKLQLGLTDSLQNLAEPQIPISWIKVSNLEGILQIGHNKNEIDGNLDIEATGNSNILQLTPRGKKIEIRVDGSTRNLRIDSQEAINNWLRVINDEYPVLVVILTGLIIAVLAGLLTPAAKTLMNLILHAKFDDKDKKTTSYKKEKKRNKH